MNPINLDRARARWPDSARKRRIRISHPRLLFAVPFYLHDYDSKEFDRSLGFDV